jgi:hypothetical protein
MVIRNSGSGADGPAVLVLNQNASSEIDNLAGSLGLALEPQEFTKVGKVRAYAGETQIGNVDCQAVLDYSGTVRTATTTANAGTLNIRSY